jgi:hypothetical protein
MPEDERSLALRAFISMENVTPSPPVPHQRIHNETDEISTRF